MPLSESRKKANRKWDKGNMTVLGCKVKREDAPKYHAAAERAGTTVNAVMKNALDDLLGKYG